VEIQMLTIRHGSHTFISRVLADGRDSALLANLLAPNMPIAPVNITMRFDGRC
jgi:hypothetical protein